MGIGRLCSRIAYGYNTEYLKEALIITSWGIYV